MEHDKEQEKKEQEEIIDQLINKIHEKDEIIHNLRKELNNINNKKH